MTRTSNYLRKGNRRLISTATESLFPSSSSYSSLRQRLLSNEDHFLNQKSASQTRSQVRSKSFVLLPACLKFFLLLIIAFFFVFLAVVIWRATSTRFY